MSDTITIKIETETEEPIAFIHDAPANYGFTVCYSHIGQHSEAHNTYERFDEVLKFGYEITETEEDCTYLKGA